MPELDTDTFAYSAGALETTSSGKWTKLSGLAALTTTGASGEVHGAASQNSAEVITNWTGSTTNQYSETVVSSASADGGPTVLSDATSTFYLLDIQSASVGKIYKCVSGTFTEIASGNPGGFNDGDTFRLDIQSGVLHGYRNGAAAFITIADSSIASGKPGIHMFDNSMLITSWAAGDFGAAPVDISWKQPTSQPSNHYRPEIVMV